MQQPLIPLDIDGILGLSLPEKCLFVGREAEFAELEAWVGFSSQKTSQKSVVALWGLAGVGKTQLVSEFVKQQREKHPSHDIFWLVGATKEAFEQSILDILDVANNMGPKILDSNTSYDEYRSKLINSFFLELRRRTRPRWLLVVEEMPSDPSLHQQIRGYLEKLPCGSIIITTRSKMAVQWCTRIMQIEGLPEVDAVKLLQRELDLEPMSENTGMDVLNLD